ncbi:MAG TPA: ArsB/NhaD family transporter [Actinomycetes bacterium]|nr:ArsB/NhaD family transporter [Actinomycetes bacterium]
MSAPLAIAVFGAAYVLIASEKVNRVAAAVGGALVVLALGVVGPNDSFFSRETGIDWNVIFLLLGMMIIVGVVKQTGIFDYLAIWAAKRAKGDPFRVMVLLVLITAVASAALDNVTTVLLVAPVTLLVCDRLLLNPVPYLIAEAMASNIGGTATLIGDPPNIIIAGRSGLSFNDFLVNLAPVVVIILVVFIGLCRVLFRKAFVAHPERVDEVMSLVEREAITNPRLLVRSMVVLALVLAGFVLHSALHLEPSVVALTGAGLLVLLSGMEPAGYLADVEWETLVFFMGLFIMVGALVKVGTIEKLATWATEATGGSVFVASMLLLVVSGVLSGIVDNIPYVATMTPLVEQLVDAAGGLGAGAVLWWSLALGADLGGNATAIGASANVVVLGIAKRNGTPISFWEFTRYGLVVATVSIAICVPYVWLRYFVLA